MKRAQPACRIRIDLASMVFKDTENPDCAQLKKEIELSPLLRCGAITGRALSAGGTINRLHCSHDIKTHTRPGR